MAIRKSHRSSSGSDCRRYELDCQNHSLLAVTLTRKLARRCHLMTRHSQLKAAPEVVAAVVVPWVPEDLVDQVCYYSSYSSTAFAVAAAETVLPAHSWEKRPSTRPWHSIPSLVE